MFNCFPEFLRLQFMRLMNFHRSPFSVTGRCCHGWIAETRRRRKLDFSWKLLRPNRVALRSADAETHWWTKARIADGLWRNMDIEHQLDGRSEREMGCMWFVAGQKFWGIVTSFWAAPPTLSHVICHQKVSVFT